MLLKRHNDPGFSQHAHIKIIKAYGHHVVVEILKNGKPQFQTSLTYSALLEYNPSTHMHSYLIER